MLPWFIHPATAFLFPLLQRNCLVDSLFYDVEALSPPERSRLTPCSSHQGSVIVVAPSDAGRGIRHYPDARRFMAEEGSRVSVVAVAGVGSSVVGTAALARSIADARDCPVAGLVTGFGLADLASQVVGGWWPRTGYPALDWARQETLRSFGWAGDGAGINGADGRDAGALLDILNRKPGRLDLLVGHSKGGFLIDQALGRFAGNRGDRYHAHFDDLTVVTLGAVVDIPQVFRHRRQFLGDMDWLGGFNSRPGVDHEKVAGSWHHLNPQIPLHLSVAGVLEAVVGA